MDATSFSHHSCADISPVPEKVKNSYCINSGRIRKFKCNKQKIVIVIVNSLWNTSKTMAGYGCAKIDVIAQHVKTPDFAGQEIFQSCTESPSRWRLWDNSVASMPYCNVCHQSSPELYTGTTSFYLTHIFSVFFSSLTTLNPDDQVHDRFVDAAVELGFHHLPEDITDAAFYFLGAVYDYQDNLHRSLLAQLLFISSYFH